MSGQPETDDPKTATNTDPNAEKREATGAGAGAAGDLMPDDLEISGDPLLDLVPVLEKERIRQEAEIKELTDRLLRAHADMDNMRKRSEREKADTAKYALTKFSLDIVSVADNLQRAMAAAGDKDSLSDDVRGVYDGIELTADELAKTLEKHGIRQIAALGSLFDPHLHQAIMEQPNPEVVSGTILQVFQEGYTIGDRVLRPSMVVVARGGAKPAKEPAAAADGAKPQPESAAASDQTGRADDNQAPHEGRGSDDDGPGGDRG